MRRNEIPEEVLRFIERRINSVPHLEALLLLRQNATRTWSDSEIAARVYVAPERARAVLEDLARSGFITSVAADRFAYNTGWDESQLMEKVAAAYRQHLVHLSEIIHAKAASEAVRDFARAFQFKPEE
jgi:hypothetical protein